MLPQESSGWGAKHKFWREVDGAGCAVSECAVWWRVGAGEMWGPTEGSRWSQNRVLRGKGGGYWEGRAGRDRPQHLRESKARDLLTGVSDH